VTRSPATPVCPSTSGKTALRVANVPKEQFEALVDKQRAQHVLPEPLGAR